LEVQLTQLEFFELLGNLGEFLGSLAVVVTLLYLARQVKHARIESERQAREASRSRNTDGIANSAYLPRILARMQEVDDSVGSVQKALIEAYGLSIEDSIRWTRYQMGTWHSWEDRYRTFGHTDDLSARISSFLDGRDSLLYWRARRVAHVPEFRRYVDDILQGKGGEPKSGEA
jgi:hypothetical protein